MIGYVIIYSTIIEVKVLVANLLYSFLLFSLLVLESCNVSWKRAVNDDYEQCTIIGAFRNSMLKTESI